MRMFKMLLPCLVLLAISASGHAEQQLVIGSQWDFMFGESNGSITANQLQRALAPYYAVYPSFHVGITGRHTELDVHYSALGERFQGETQMTSISHIVTLGYSIRANKRLKFRLDGSFSTLPDFNTYSVIQGVAPSPSGFQFVFQPALAKSSRHEGRGEAGVVYDFSYRSFLSLDTSVTSLRYSSGNVLAGSLVNQLRTDAEVGYGYRISPHQTIGIRYLIVENDYHGFGTGRTQSAAFDYTRQISPVTQVRVGGGPAIVTYRNQPRHYGYTASASLVRKIRTSILSANYFHTPGDSSGFSTLSNTHSGGITFFSPRWKGIELKWSISGFRGEEFGNQSNYHGVYSSLDISRELNRQWSVAVGGAYLLNIYSSPVNQEYKRMYISLRYSAPNLWRPSL